MDTDKRLKEIEARLKKMYAGEWTACANLPFNVDLRKPRPSLSKHDHKHLTYWHMDDAIFILNARQDVSFLLDLIKQLTKEQELEHVTNRNDSSSTNKIPRDLKGSS